MKKILFVLFLIVLCTIKSFSQYAYERLHGISEADYSLKTELILDYNYLVKINKETEDYQSGSLSFKSYGFLNFNKNDLSFFKAEPKEFIETPLLIDIDCCFSDSKGQNEEVAGLTNITEFVVIKEDDVKSEINLKGIQLSSI